LTDITLVDKTISYLQIILFILFIDFCDAHMKSSS